MSSGLDGWTPHLAELRRRLVVCVLCLAVTSTAAYLAAQPICRFLVTPLLAASPRVSRLVYTNLPEAFLATLKLSLLVGLAASFPVLLFQAWRFIAPALHGEEKRATGTVVIAGTLLFAAGMVFSRFAVLPVLLDFFLGYGRERLAPLPRFGDYLTFVARTALGFGLAFEIPFLMVMVARSGAISPQYFHENRWMLYGVLGGLALLLSAGDFLAAAMLAIPLAGLYECGIVAGRLFVRRASV